jgi:monoamine oxidase
MSRSGFKTNLGRQLCHVQKIARASLAIDASMDQVLDRTIKPSTRTKTTPAPTSNSETAPTQFNSDDRHQGLSVGIVGAGFAGLACGDELQKLGIRAEIFEAGDRTGGRCWSMGGEFGNAELFPGQVIERGGELIDSQHHTLLNYAQEFGLVVEDLCAIPGDSTFYFKGSHYSEAAIVEEYLELLKAMGSDIQQVSPEPTALNHRPFDVALDRMNLSEYLDKYQAGDLARAYIEASYQGEFGFSLEDQTCLHFILMNLDAGLENPLEIFSDEQYHIQGGNEQIIRHLTRRLQDQIQLGHRLIAIRKTSRGSIELIFDRDGTTLVKTFDAVVLTVPFPALRSVELHPNLAIPDWKQQAIAKLDNGSQAKMMVSFNGRPWRDHGSTGVSHSDLSHHQVTWEANPSQGCPTSQGTIVHLASGSLGLSLDNDRFQAQAQNFLQDFDRIYPGANQQARRDRRGQVRGHIEQWATNPLAQGAYLCYRPSQFTQFTGLEGIAIDNLFFAGEHTDSFYAWQGFLEGAALSGIKVARQINEKIH